MRARLSCRVAPLAAIAACALALASAEVQCAVTVENVEFPVADATDRYAAVAGELRIPDSRRAHLPAVVIVNSAPGFDGRGAFYAEALGEAGIVTLEIDMFQGRGLPASVRHNLPHAFQALQYLAHHPRVDPQRIGIMGFSWGGAVAVLASSDELARHYAGGELRFVAHLGLYAGCWIHHDIVAGRSKDVNPSAYRKSTGRPVYIVAGGRDDYDGADGCWKFLVALPAEVRADFSLTVYPDATFGWDSRYSSAFYTSGARQGKGGVVTVVADTEIAAQSRRDVVRFFRKTLAAQ
jgi:dienelactone hydrolase